VRRGAVAEIGKAAVLREGSDVTIVGTLLMVERALKAAEQLDADGISAEVIDLRWVRPLDLETIRASVAKTGRLVIAEEQVHAGGWGATIISELTMGGQAWASPPRAVGLPADIPIPYSPPLEDQVIPAPERIAEAARATLGR
jgi:acetoin:2,6-dichlorophenolindophenol oxidoreductase subunit beta